MKNQRIRVKIAKPLQIRVVEAGKRESFRPLVDREGTWVQVEVLDGESKGNRFPITKEALKKHKVYEL